MSSELRLVTSNGLRRLRPTRATTRIMVVDDDPVAGRTLTEALELAGYRVRIAVTGTAACGLQPRMQPDLVILELMLPDMDGLALTMTLKSMTDAPIIICSARQGHVDRALALRLGAAEFVAKPFERDDLLARVEAVVPSVQNDQHSASPTTRMGQRRQA